MNAKILNREFQHPSDGWYMIEPKGRHPNKAAGLVQVIDDTACASIVNRFNADAAAGKLSHGDSMLIDHEHFKHDADKETVAYGWLTGLANRADGYYGQIRWTGRGKPAVDNGDYRFFSTEYDPADLTVLNKEGKGQAVRPMRLDGLTLTNDPNNKGGRPITNRSLVKIPADGCCPDCACALQDAPADAAFNADMKQCPQCQTNFAGPVSPAANQPTTQNRPMKNVATKLGLAAEASEESVLAAVTKLLNRPDVAVEEFTTIKNRNTTLDAENKTLKAEQVDAILAEHQIKEPKVINRLKPMLEPLANRTERLTALADMGYKIGQAKPAGGGERLLNRGGTKLPDVEMTDADVAAESARATKVMNRAKALMKETPHLSLADASLMADRETA